MPVTTSPDVGDKTLIVGFVDAGGGLDEVPPVFVLVEDVELVVVVPFVFLGVVDVGVVWLDEPCWSAEDLLVVAVCLAVVTFVVTVPAFGKGLSLAVFL